jgi:hypothetical protein
MFSDQRGTRFDGVVFGLDLMRDPHDAPIETHGAR